MKSHSADGHARVGLWARERAELFKQVQTSGFLMDAPVALWLLQIMTVLCLMWVLLAIIAFAEHSNRIFRWWWIAFLLLWIAAEILTAPLYDNWIRLQLTVQYQQSKQQLER
ncbi:MAG: hypothetical protein C4294_19600 [Nitrospiraceae bacterium]